MDEAQSCARRQPAFGKPETWCLSRVLQRYPAAAVSSLFRSWADYFPMSHGIDRPLGDAGLKAFIGDGICIRVLSLGTGRSRHKNHNRSIRVVEHGLRTRRIISANRLEAGKMRGIPRNRCVHFNIVKKIEIGPPFALADL